MLRRSTAERDASEPDPTPTPSLASHEQQTAEARRVDEQIARHAHARSIEELPPELRDNPLIRAIVSMTPEEEARMLASMAARREAQVLYGEDAAAELAALEAGAHPLQRRAHAAP